MSWRSCVRGDYFGEEPFVIEVTIVRPPHVWRWSDRCYYYILSKLSVYVIGASEWSGAKTRRSSVWFQEWISVQILDITAWRLSLSVPWVPPKAAPGFLQPRRAGLQWSRAFKTFTVHSNPAKPNHGSQWVKLSLPAQRGPALSAGVLLSSLLRVTQVMLAFIMALSPDHSHLFTITW